MSLYGILKSNVNTGADSEILIEFAAPLNINSNQPVFSSDTASLRQVVSSQNVQRWELEANLKPSSNSADALVHSVGYGKNQFVYVRMPQVYRGDTKRTFSEVTVASNQPRAASIVSLEGGGNKLLSGDFISFTNHKKVYLVLEVLNNGAQVRIAPGLRANVSAGEKVVIGDAVTMRCRYDQSAVLGIKYKDGILSDPGSVKLIEAI